MCNKYLDSSKHYSKKLNYEKKIDLIKLIKKNLSI